MTWDPDGPTYDEPKVRRERTTRPIGRHPLSADYDSDENSDDNYMFPSANLESDRAECTRKRGLPNWDEGRQDLDCGRETEPAASEVESTGYRQYPVLPPESFEKVWKGGVEWGFDLRSLLRGRTFCPRPDIT